MDIKLIPVGSGQRFTFPSLPEKITGKYAAKYQSFDIISQGTVKVPKGTDSDEFTWSHVFFGPSKKNEPIVKKSSYQEPNACVNIIREYMANETVLNLIVTETWINVDVTVSSFEASPVGAYGNIEYTITFTRKKPLQIYSTNELKIAAFVKKTKPRTSSTSSASTSSKGTYTIVSGDTLWGIASKKCGGGANWTKLYDANSSTIEAAAKSHGKSSSDHGHWIWPGTTLQLV
jgi:nucleoid-associated protein YgaU